MTICLIEAIAPMLIPMAIGVAGSIGKMFGRGAANRRLRDLASRMPQYKANPLAAQQLGLAQTLLNARMPGAAAAEQNIYQTQANQMAQAQRAATDPNQLLLTGAAAAGQAGEQFRGLGQMEAQDYQRRYGNLAQAQAAQIAEQEKEYQDQLNRYQMQSQIEAAQQENRQNTWGDISNLGFAGANVAMQGGFNNLFGKTGGGNAMGRMSAPAATAPAMVNPSMRASLAGQGQVPSSKLNISPFQTFNPSNYLNDAFQGSMRYRGGSKLGSTFMMPSPEDAYNLYNYNY